MPLSTPAATPTSARPSGCIVRSRPGFRRLEAWFQRHVVAQPRQPLPQTAGHFGFVLPVKMIGAQFLLILAAAEHGLGDQKQLMGHREDRLVVSQLGAQAPVQPDNLPSDNPTRVRAPAAETTIHDPDPSCPGHIHARALVAPTQFRPLDLQAAFFRVPSSRSFHPS